MRDLLLPKTGDRVILTQNHGEPGVNQKETSSETLLASWCRGLFARWAI
jgi:hypothetical protein